MDTPRLEMHHVCKHFGATAALTDVDLVVQAGEDHALIGENGAGKSTLMKILAGALRPDAGHIRLDGRPFLPANPLAARTAGVAMIYQELNLAPHLSVEENITLGAEHRRAGFIRHAAHRRRIADIFQRLGRPDLRPETPVRRLSSAERQLVEIARALLTEARVLVMDEPTSSLGLADIAQLFASSTVCGPMASPSSTSRTSSKKCSASPSATPCCATDATSAATPWPTRRSARSSS